MKRILVAIDFSEVTDEVVSMAIKLDKLVDGRLRILHVEDSAPYSYTPKEGLPHKPGFNRECRPLQGGKGNLGDIESRLSKEQIDAEYRVLAGPAAENILAAAGEFDADIIVIGKHEHGKFFRFLFGDTTDSLIGKATCPILIVPHIKGSGRRAF
jgi:nucleotide-binding universal stress UspA family protein